MLTDLAALTPPLVMAVAFIAGVVFLVRREMAPRRRGGMDHPEDADSRSGPHGEIQAPVFTQARGGRRKGDGEPAPGNNSAHNHAAGSGMEDLPGSEDDGDIRRAEGQPPAPPKV
jgi:hypothetical protein